MCYYATSSVLVKYSSCNSISSSSNQIINYSNEMYGMKRYDQFLLFVSRESARVQCNLEDKKSMEITSI